MRVVVVHPEKDGLRGGSVSERRNRHIRRGGCAPLGSPAIHLIVELVKAARQPEPPGQNERRHNGRRAVTGLLQALGDKRLGG